MWAYCNSLALLVEIQANAVFRGDSLIPLTLNAHALRSRSLFLDYISKRNFHTWPKQNVFKMFTAKVICVLCEWQLLGWGRRQPTRLFMVARTWSSVMRRVKHGRWALCCAVSCSIRCDRDIYLLRDLKA